MKKLCAVAVLVVAAAFAFGQEMSVGGGVSYGSFWMAGGGNFTGGDMTETWSYPQLGFHGFFDAQYVEVGLGYYINSSQSDVVKQTGFSDNTTNTSYHASWLDVSVVGKYPFDLGGFTLFPLAGLEYMVNLTYTDSNGNDLKSLILPDYKNFLDALLVKFGLGADIPVAEKFYIRPELTIGYKILKSKYDSNGIDYYTSNGLSDAYLNWWNFRGAILVGYRL